MPSLLHSIEESIRRRLKSTLAQNTGWMLFGQGLKLVIQAFYFTVIARSLGPARYGAFVGVVGLVGILFPFGTMGSGYLLIKNVARDKNQFAKSWGTALSTTVLSSSLLFGLVLLLSRFVLPGAIPVRLVILVAASDLYGQNVIAVCAQAFLAFERLKWTAWITVSWSASRLIAAAILAASTPSPSTLQWGAFYFVSTTVVAVLSLFLVLAKLGRPTLDFARTIADAREGFYFSVSQSAQTIYNDIDKTMLARLSTLEATGIYGAAYRLIDVSFTPVSALLAAAYTSLFRLGANGISATVGYARPLILRAVGYSALVTIAVMAGAGIVPRVLGSDYRPTAEALRWLAVLPMLKAVHYFLSDALAGAGHQALRTLAHVGVAAFNVLINLWLIPAYAWRGAAWSSIASDALLAVAMGAVVLGVSRRSQTVTASVEALEMRVEA